MPVRRITALLLAVFLLHLNFLGADFGCSNRGDESAQTGAELVGATGQPPAGAGHHHGSAHAESTTSAEAMMSTATSHADEQPPCQIPQQSNCCQAFMGCSVVYAANNASAVANATVLNAMNVRGSLNTPRSERVAPEPPPPRA